MPPPPSAPRRGNPTVSAAAAGAPGRRPMSVPAGPRAGLPRNGERTSHQADSRAAANVGFVAKQPQWQPDMQPPDGRAAGNDDRSGQAAAPQRQTKITPQTAERRARASELPPPSPPPPHGTSSPGGELKQRRKPLPWTDAEINFLKRGVRRYRGEAWMWKKILEFGGSTWRRRTAVDLKDKWRNLIKYSGSGDE
eukprot:SM001489S01079  [mRNA]  locus=s1489:1049:2054:- [translate_table: standard]